VEDSPFFDRFSLSNVIQSSFLWIWERPGRETFEFAAESESASPVQDRRYGGPVIWFDSSAVRPTN
jgi:hypothetical protein